MSKELDELATRSMAAIESGDVAAMQEINHDDLWVWHSFDAAIQNKQENIALLGGLKLLGKAKYNVIERICVGNRIIQRHDLVVLSKDGSQTYTVPAAIFMTVQNGQIIKIEEYADTRDVGILIAAIQEEAAKLHSADA